MAVPLLAQSYQPDFGLSNSAEVLLPPTLTDLTILPGEHV